jgi:multidrug efflux pump subunit AcrB
VVAGEAIKRELAAGTQRLTAAWLGTTRLATAILFATLTNIAAYLPLLLLTGNQGDLLHSLPIVMACALVASRIVSLLVPVIYAFVVLDLRLVTWEGAVAEDRRNLLDRG